MSTSTDPNAWLLGGTVPSAKFEARGDTVTGVISETPELRQQTDFDTQQPKFWDDGKPMMQMLVELQTDQRDPAILDDDGRRRMYVRGQMRNAFVQAVRKAGVKGLAVGGQLTVTYSADGEQKKKGFNPPKIYSVEYVPPMTAAATDFLAQPEPVAAAAPAPAAVPTTPAPSHLAQTLQAVDVTDPHVQALLAQLVAKGA